MTFFPDDRWCKVACLQAVHSPIFHHGFTHPQVAHRHIWELSHLLLLVLLITTGGISLAGQTALAQTVIRHDSGAVQVDHNAFDFETGPLENRSYIPLPAHLLGETHERQAQPVIPNQWSPNSLLISPDVDYIDRSFNQLLGQEADNLSYTLQGNSLQMTTRFNLGHRAGAHDYGEGIEVTVLRPDGSVRSRDTVFVSGGKVTIGPDGQELPVNAELNVTYGADETVQLRVLNIREDGEEPSESGIYFSQNGEFVVEDLQNGGDLDFNDGDYVQLSGGQGAAQTLRERRNISYDTQQVKIPLDPTLRQEVVEQVELSQDLIEYDVVSEIDREWGQIELPETVATRLGHARAASTGQDEWLVYDRYASAAQVRLGSDGAGLTGQLAPLVNNPNVPPTLLTGNVTFNPTVADNEAGLTTTVGITQFLTPTHRVARDVFGHPIAAATAAGPTLLEPTGLMTNRRLIGYVPPTFGETVMDEPLTSVAGIFEIPTDQAVRISPPDPQQVGRGNAAYTDNVGGLLLEDPTGTVEFVPQWSASGYAQEHISLSAGDVQRIIYALVPQQPGQALQLGERYAVRQGADGYRIAAGDFTVISADQQPQNFLQERALPEIAEVYAVEDTLPGANAVTELFNGIQGIYAEEIGGDRIPTVDLTLPGEADARVGNTLLPLASTIVEPGQRAYAQTTVAAGVYLGGSLTTGIGNQRDTLTLMTTTMEQSTDEIRTITTTNTFATPLTQIDNLTVETVETTVERGTASFEINGEGEVANVSFSDGEIQNREVNSNVTDRTSRLQQGDEILLGSITEETSQFMEPRLEMIEQDMTSERDAYANVAPLQGEIALGGVLNFGNTPWSPAANTLRAELFARDSIVGRDSDSQTGWRTELVFHPFGEQQREAFQYDEDGNVVPVYKTEPLLTTEGEQVVETLTDEDGTVVEVPVNQFVRDEAGDRIAQTSGTGRPEGPGLYLRAEDVFSDDEGLVVSGGVQFAF